MIPLPFLFYVYFNRLLLWERFFFCMLPLTYRLVCIYLSSEAKFKIAEALLAESLLMVGSNYPDQVVILLWFTGTMQRDNWPLFSALRYLTCSRITKAHGLLTWQRSEFTKANINCYREQSTKVRNVLSRVWKNIIYICFVILKGEYWLVLCFALSRQDFFSLSPTQRLVSCAVCLCRRRNVSFAFIPFFLAIQWGQKKSC